MSERLFRFKSFEVNHERSAMKVGVDAVLLGAWAGTNATNILDIGTGCGVIALILAQRFPTACVVGVDIDIPSLEEAEENFKNSPWNDRLKALYVNFPTQREKIGAKFDLIVSNPPYYKSGIVTPQTPRERARHQNDLSPMSLLEYGRDLLLPDGKIAMIVPAELEEDLLKASEVNGLKPERICWVRDNERRPVKRMLVEFGIRKESSEFRGAQETFLTLFTEGSPTASHHELCKDLYLKF